MDAEVVKKLSGFLHEDDRGFTVSRLKEQLTKIEAEGGGELPVYNKHYYAGNYCYRVAVSTEYNDEGHSFTKDPPTVILE